MVKIDELLNALRNLNPELLYTIIDTLPIEFTVIDADDQVMFWNKHGIRIFKRGPAVIGRNVRMCHPQDSVHKVEQVIQTLRSGEKDFIEFWLDYPDGDTPRKVLVRYSALRDEEGNYKGVLETSVNLTDFQGYEGENRLGDFEP
ncbi:MAG: PAS domain-containing protein [Candidatus Thorarchaeota archaeon]